MAMGAATSSRASRITVKSAEGRHCELEVVGVHEFEHTERYTYVDLGQRGWVRVMDTAAEVRRKMEAAHGSADEGAAADRGDDGPGEPTPEGGAASG